MGKIFLLTFSIILFLHSNHANSFAIDSVANETTKNITQKAEITSEENSEKQPDTEFKNVENIEAAEENKASDSVTLKIEEIAEENIEKLNENKTEEVENVESSEETDKYLKIIGEFIGKFIAIYIAIVVVGIILGLSKVIVVFEDFTDAALCVGSIYFPFMAGIIIAILFGISIPFGMTEVIGNILLPIIGVVAVIEAGLICWILFISFRSNTPLKETLHIFNSNPLKALLLLSIKLLFGTVKSVLSILTKLPLGIIYGISILQIFAPSGKTFQNRHTSKRRASAFLMFFTPILIKLVNKKTGIFSPKNIPALRRYGIGQDFIEE
ncbi:MAG: hypothetical protein KAJ75_02345 [Alphaproteobacteria bacterium]|nr:hypothetical protein [Alphaproteobacteria bacterium]